jgi:hypothetical protein
VLRHDNRLSRRLPERDDVGELADGGQVEVRRGFVAETLAQAMRCFCPPESLKRLRSSRPPSPKSPVTALTASAICGSGQPMFSQPKASSLVLSTLKNWLRGFWKTLPTLRPVSATGVSETSMPSTRMRPQSSPSKNSGTRPLTMRVSVVFPQPDSPQSTTTSPGSTSRLTSTRLAVAAPR